MSNIRLDIDKKEAKDFLDFLLSKRQAFINENAGIFNELNKMTENIDSLRAKLDNYEQTDYPVGASWNQRIQFLLEGNEEGLTARQITSLMATKEGITDLGEFNKYYASVAPTLSAATDKLYERKTNKKNEYVYTLKK